MIVAVNVLVKNLSENTVLVVERSTKDDHWAGMLALPGGHIEEGESLEEAAKRELLEETGYELISVTNTPLASIHMIEQKEAELVLVEGEIGEKITDKLDSDIISAKWVQPLELLNSLSQHEFPNMQIERLKILFKEKGLTI